MFLIKVINIFELLVIIYEYGIKVFVIMENLKLGKNKDYFYQKNIIFIFIVGCKRDYDYENDDNDNNSNNSNDNNNNYSDCRRNDKIVRQCL